MSRKKTTCFVCESTSIDRFLEIAQVPVLCNVPLSAREEAEHVIKSDIKLEVCKNCGHIFNSAFYPDLMNYNENYETSLHFSPRFQEYDTELITRLIDTYDVHKKNILDIGCGKGRFLTLLCEQGNNKGIGFDPGCSDEQIKNSTKQIKFIKDSFSDKYRDYEADLICCRHVLEHVQYPREFLALIRDFLGHKTGAAVFFEVPNVKFMLKDLSIWDFIYEHCSYYCKNSLNYLFASSGFEVLNLNEAFGEQYLCIEAKPLEDKREATIYDTEEIKQLSEYVETFAEKYQAKISTWRQKLREMAQANKKVVIWGAGSKGIMFLNTFKIRGQIEYAVDINPHKQGKYIAGTGQRIVPPAFLLEYKPDTVIVMNPIYKDEIKHTVDDIGVKVEFLYA